MNRLILCLSILFYPSTLLSQEKDDLSGSVFPPARTAQIPHVRWAHRAESDLWTRSALSALKQHGAGLVDMVPRDIGDWCPAYPTASAEKRRAFWVGFLSALAKYESTHRPHAVGGGGRWFGLLQILPATARGYGCRARSGRALLDGPANLSCAIRIMTRTVRRDGVVSRGMRGVAADWGPLVSRSKRHEMMAWTKAQKYCTPLSSVRPRARPVAWVGTRGVAEVRPKVRPPGDFEIEIVTPKAPEVDIVRSEGSEVAVPVEPQIEIIMPVEGETASPEELEMEIVTPEEGDSASSEELELEIVTPEVGERAASGELEIEIVTRQDGQAASADDLDIEIVEPKAREEALELDIIQPGQLEIVSP